MDCLCMSMLRARSNTLATGAAINVVRWMEGIFSYKIWILMFAFIAKIQPYLFYEKGIFTTFACSSLSLTLMKIFESMAAYGVRTNPIPIALPRLGDCVPEVTTPIVAPV